MIIGTIWLFLQIGGPLKGVRAPVKVAEVPFGLLYEAGLEVG